jgi:hypothetical protein
MTQLAIVNGDDRTSTLRRLKTVAGKAKGAGREHLLSVLRSLNPTAARSRATKGASSMKKKHTKKAAQHHKRRSNNPTYEGSLRQVGAPSSSRGTGFKSKVRSATSRAAANLKGADVMGILVGGAGVGVGLLGAAAGKKLADKFLPASVHSLIKAGLSSVAVAGAAVALGGGKGFLRDVAKGAIASLVFTAGQTFAPSVFAGTDDGNSTGYWDSATGQWISADGQVAGVAYDPTLPLPMNLSVRPAGL